MKLGHAVVTGSILQILCWGAAQALATPAIPQPLGDRGFKVYQKVAGEWRAAGFLAFNEFFSEAKLPVGNGEKPLVLRLEKIGIGNGHLDLARVNGQRPQAVDGDGSPFSLMKLEAKDFDVVRFAENDRFLELQFPTGGELRIAARVEGSFISQTPFRFPPSNNYSLISPKSEFYRFSPTTEPQILFAEETSPGTGHPWGVATASSMLDSRNLYVRLDFQSDNTLDGGKDYASLHLHTTDGVKTFTVRQDERRWGEAKFGYTSEVPWQHKIYDFTIPRSELPESETIELAMSAYGTAAISWSSPALAYGAQNQEYMAAYIYDNNSSEWQVRSQLVEKNGDLSGSFLPVTDLNMQNKSNADIAYDGNTDHFLVVWENDDVPYIQRTLISGDNQTTSDVLPITSHNQLDDPAVAYNVINGRFLLAWEEWTIVGTNSHIGGSIVNAVNQIVAETVISDVDSRKDHPRIAGIGEGGFLVVWEDNRNATMDKDIYFRMIAADGTPMATDAPVFSGPGSQAAPDIAYDPVRQRALIVWEDYNDGGYDVRGRFVTAGGILAGEAFFISEASGGQYQPQVAYAGNGNFLVVWQDQGVQPHYEIHGRFYTSNGETLGDERTFVSMGDNDVENPSLTGSGGTSLLLAYNYYDIDLGTEDFGTVAISAPASSKLLLYMPAILQPRERQQNN